MPPTGRLPRDRELRSALGHIMRTEVELLDRDVSLYSSTARIERIEARTATRSLSLVCKHGSDRIDPLSGHTRGPEYESFIYERILPGRAITTPRYCGSFTTGPTTRCIVLEYVDGFRVERSPDPLALPKATAALARLHTVDVPRAPGHLNRFDPDYFMRWVQPASQLNGGDLRRARVIDRLVSSFGDVVKTLARAPLTLIHGELYPPNVLLGSSGPVFLDWETAGIGPGVFDLAVLIQGRWKTSLVEASVDAYLNALGSTAGAQTIEALAAARAVAGLQLLHHQSDKDPDPVTRAAAITEIDTQLTALGIVA